MIATPAPSIVAVVDVRDRAPLDLSPLRCEAAPLVGYSVRGRELQIAVVCKSTADLMRAFSSQKERFAEELRLLNSRPWSALVVQSTWEEIEAHRQPVDGRIVARALRHLAAGGLYVFIAGDRDAAGRIVSRMLTSAADLYNKARRLQLV